MSDFQDIATEIIDKETKMHSLLTPNITDSKTPKFVDAHIAAVQKSGEYKTLETRLNQLRKERDEILTGKKSKYYFEQGLFLGTNTLVSGFVHDFGIKRYSRVHYDKNYNELTEDEKRIVTEKYQEYLTNEGKDLAYTAFEIFYNLSDKLSGHINSQNARIQSFRDRLYKDSSIFNEQLGLKQNDLNIINKQIEETGETETLLEAKKQLESEIKELHNNPLNLLSLGVNNLISITGDFDTDIKLLNDYIDLIKNQNGYIDFTDVNKKNLLTSIASVFDLITMSDDTKQRLKNAILNEDLELFTRIAGEVDEMDDIATQIEAVLVKLNSLEKSPSEILIKAALEYLDNGDNIYLELINVFEDFVTSPSIDSFEIQDDTTIENLQTLQSLINIVSSIVLSAGEGDFNFIVNKVHKSNKPVISKNSSEELLKGLNLMSKRIELLLQVGDMNRIAQKTIQKRVYYNMRRKMLESILDSEMKNKIETEFKIDLTQLYTQCEFPEGVSEENFDDYEKAAIKFETLFRDAAYEMLENTEDMHTELINKVFNIYGNKIFADKLTVFSADPNIIIADRDKAIYLLSILASPSSNFYLKYKELIASEQYTLAPLYPQEYTVKLIYSFASNKEFLKSLYE